MEAYIDTAKVLILEPFYGGSHKKLIETIMKTMPIGVCQLVKTSPGQQNWRSKTAALYISTKVPRKHRYQYLFCTSYLPLAELIGLRPDLAPLHKVLYYFHDSREMQADTFNDRNFQLTYCEITSCLAADQVFFDCYHNMMKFIDKLKHHMQTDMGFWPPNMDQKMEAKSKAVYYPLNVKLIDQIPESSWKKERKELVIIWPHRWHHDRNPLKVFKIFERLDKEGFNFSICVLDEPFYKKPCAFHVIIENHKTTKLFDFGHIDSELEYYGMMRRADVVLSTAMHEFFGVSVLEAVYCGCIPVVPKKWSYTELYGKQVREMYDDDEEIYNILANLCRQKMAGALHHNYRLLAAAHNAESWFRNVMRNISNIPTE